MGTTRLTPHPGLAPHRTMAPTPVPRSASHGARDNASPHSSVALLSFTDRLAVTGLSVLFVLAVLAAKPEPAFSVSAECGEGTGPICSYTRYCVAWVWVWTHSFPGIPIPIPVCAAWAEEIQYSGPGDDAERDSTGSQSEEPDPTVPTDGVAYVTPFRDSPYRDAVMRFEARAGKGR